MPLLLMLLLGAAAVRVKAEEGFSVQDGILTGYSGDAEHVAVPQGVTKIGGDAFGGNRTIKTVTLPETVQEIGKGAFFNCTKLEAVYLPESLTVISERAFQACYNLRNIRKQGYTLPGKLKTIEYAAFFGTALEKIRIPKSVTKIENIALPYCYVECYAGTAGAKYAACKLQAFQTSLSIFMGKPEIIIPARSWAVSRRPPAATCWRPLRRRR